MLASFLEDVHDYSVSKITSQVQLAGCGVVIKLPCCCILELQQRSPAPEVLVIIGLLAYWSQYDYADWGEAAENWS